MGPPCLGPGSAGARPGRGGQLQASWAGAGVPLFLPEGRGAGQARAHGERAGTWALREREKGTHTNISGDNELFFFH